MNAGAADAPALQARIRRAQAGQRQAFSELVSEHQSQLRRQLRGLTKGDEALADDLAQEAFVQAWRHLAQFRFEARFATWLHRIAHNAFLMQQRRSGLPDAPAPAPANEADAPEAAGDELVDPASLGAAEQSALKLDLARAMARLPTGERLALQHCYQLDLSHEEAAAVLQWPIGTLKTHVLRGKARLRNLLAAWAPETAR